MEMVAVTMMTGLITAVIMMTTISMLQPCAVLVVGVTSKVTTLSNMPDHAFKYIGCVNWQLGCVASTTQPR